MAQIWGDGFSETGAEESGDLNMRLWTWKKI